MDKHTFKYLKEKMKFYTLDEEPKEKNLFHICGCEHYDCYFESEDEFEFDEKLEKLYFSFNEISLTLSMNSFREILIEELYKNPNLNIESLESILQNIPLKEFTIIREIFGLEIENEESLNLDKIIISSLLKLDSNIKTLLTDTRLGFSPKYCVYMNVTAQDNNKAIEIAHNNFNNLFRLLRIIIQYPLKNIPISSQINISTELKTFCLSSNKSSYKYENKNNSKNIVVEKYQIEKDFNEHYLNLLEILVKENKTDFELRIENSLKWLSDSYFDSDIHIKFLKAMIAFEVLFTYSEKTLVNPSIANQISETVAFVIGENVEEKIEIEKRMKDFYGIRSSIAHSGKSKIRKEDYLELCKYMTIVLIILSTKKDFKADNTKEFYEKIKIMKYS